MTRLDSPNRVTVKPAINVYSGLAVLSFLAIASALGYAIYTVGKLKAWF